MTDSRHKTEELAEELDVDLAASQKAIKARDLSLKGCVTDLLKRDDRTLSELQQLAARVDVSGSKSGEDIRRVERLCKK